MEANPVIIDDAFYNRLLATFPPQTIPSPFFWPDDNTIIRDEFSRDVGQHLANRAWTEITIGDWTMIDLTISRERMSPSAFLYYLPSLWCCVLQDDRYLYLALEAMLPSGRDRKPKGSWWIELLRTIKPEQRVAVSDFLSLARCAVDQIEQPEFTVSADQALLLEAEAFWTSDDSPATMA